MSEYSLFVAYILLITSWWQNFILKFKLEGFNVIFKFWKVSFFSSKLLHMHIGRFHLTFFFGKYACFWSKLYLWSYNKTY